MDLVLRDGQPHEHPAIAAVLESAFADTDVGRWLDADPGLRLAHFTNLLPHAIVRVAADRGDVVGVALWFPFPMRLPAGEVDGADPAVERYRLLERLLAERHPWQPPHHHLAYLGVRPDRQRQGIGTCLLIEHHAYLHVSGIPAYLEANDPRNHELYLRHGYTDVAAPIVLPTGIPIWPMWRPPLPADRPAPPPADVPAPLGGDVASPSPGAGPLVETGPATRSRR
jgi:GNAT superfamily N-acetyltransferase